MHTLTNAQMSESPMDPDGVCVCVCVQECVLNYRLEPLGNVDGFIAEVGASGSFCPSHMTLPVDVSFYSVSEDNAPSPYMVSLPFLIVYFRNLVCVCVSTNIMHH